jgi:hypothetical protein
MFAAGDQRVSLRPLSAGVEVVGNLSLLSDCFVRDLRARMFDPVWNRADSGGDRAAESGERHRQSELCAPHA